VALILTALFLLVFATAAGAGYDLSHWMLAVKQARHEAEFEAVSAVMEPGRADGKACIQVRRTVPVRMSRAVLGRDSFEVAGRACAVQVEVKEWTEGLFPLAVRALGPSPGFGLELGQAYPLELIEEPVARTLRRGIMEGYQTVPRRVGMALKTVSMSPGEIEIAVRERIASDADPAAAGLDGYSGNGRRIVAVPVIGDGGTMAGVAAFFLESPTRAQFAGSYLQGGRRTAAARSGYFVARVVR